jgi:hypothetical protein
MMKPTGVIFVAAIGLALVSAGADETSVTGGGAGVPLGASPGPGAGVTAPPGQGLVRVPEHMVGQVPHPMQAPPLSRDQRDCSKTVCGNRNGGD